MVVTKISVSGLNRLVSFDALQNAWKRDGVDLHVELKTTPGTLTELATRAEKVIQQTYEATGQAVMVEHEILTLATPRYVGVRFLVTPAARRK